MLFLFSGANGQTFLSDQISGKPYMLTTYNDIRGTAFLFDEWKTSDVIDINGTGFFDVNVKFDVYANKFLYLHGDTTYEFVTRIDEVRMFERSGNIDAALIFKKGFSVTGKLSPDKFVQVLAEGKITVVKHINKALQELTEYGVPGKIKVFVDKTAYFFITENNSMSQRPNQKLLRELVKEKWPDVEAYLKENSLNLKEEGDCIRVIKYYNSL
jgi:hypothetical protein